MILINKCVLVTFLFISFVAGQQYKGDECRLKDGSNGICKLIGECPAAIANIRKGIYPQQCGFEGTQVVVCCLEYQPKPITTPKPTEQPKPVTTPKPTEQPKPVTTPKPIEPLKPVTSPKPTELPGPAVSPSDLYSKSRPPGVISNQKCRDYSEYVWTVEPNPTLLVGASDIRRNECPFYKQELVVGGDPATRKEFPHMVQFGYDASDGLKWTCGGSLISDQYVLTAAHCLSDRSLGDAKYARMGIVNLEDEDHMQQVNIEKIIPHPEHEEPSHYHDIGLVKLSTSVKLNAFVRPACIYSNRSSPWSKVIASGWGKTDFAGAESIFLQRVILELYDQPKCNKTYRQQYGTNKLQEGIIDETMICAGHSKDLKDTCQGDSGGPLQVYRNEDKQLACMYDVVGVTSFGKACGLAVNVPAVYTRVSYYTKWIEDIVWPPTI